MQFRKLALVGAGVLTPACAFAGSQTITITEPIVTFATIQASVARPYTVDFTVGPFDAALGRLIDVRLEVANTSTLTETVSSLNPQLVSYSGAKSSAGLTVTGPDGTADTATVTAGAYSGTIQAAAGLETIRNRGVQTTLSQIVDITDPARLEDYEGWAPLQFAVTYGRVQNSGATPGLFYGGSGTTGGTFEIAYTYAVPEVSTWALMALGFAALHLAGFRSTRKPRLLAL